MNLRLRVFLRDCAMRVPAIRRLVQHRNLLLQDVDDARARLLELNSALKAQQDLFAQLETECEVLLVRHDALLKSRLNLTEQRDAFQVENKRLSRELASITSERNELGELRFRFEHERDLAHAEIDQLKERLATCSPLDQTAHQSTTYAALSELRYELEHERDVAIARHDKLANELATLLKADTPSNAGQTIIIFQHLPKTGGTTLGQILTRGFVPEEQLSVSPLPRGSALGTWLLDDVRQVIECYPSDELRKIRFVGGHLPFRVHALLDGPCRYVTLLREPIDRVLSGFYYSMAENNFGYTDAVTLEDYVWRREHYDLGLNDHQTRVLSGLAELDPEGKITTGTARAVTNKDLEVAKNNLQRHYALVGLTDKFDEFVVVLARLLGWPLAAMVHTRLNVTAGRPPRGAIAQETLTEIASQNLNDGLLYQFAMRLFDRAVESYGPEYENHLRLFRALNEMHKSNATPEQMSAEEIRARQQIRVISLPMDLKPKKDTGRETRDDESSPGLLIFLHIAKTGGATLGRILNRQFAYEEIFSANPGSAGSALGVWPSAAVAEKFHALPRDAQARVRLLPGHFMFGIHQVLNRPGRYITLMRHPVDRVVSSYYYILSQPGIAVRNTLIEQNMTLDDYVRSGLGLDAHNYQTRILAGQPEYDAPWDKVATRITVPHAVLDLAMKNLNDHFLLAGIVEEFNEFLLALREIFSWPLARILYTKVNRTAGRPSIREIPRQTIRLIEEANQLDLELYEFVRRRFREERDRWFEEITFFLPRFEALNTLYESLPDGQSSARQRVTGLCSVVEQIFSTHSRKQQTGKSRPRTAGT